MTGRKLVFMAPEMVQVLDSGSSRCLQPVLDPAASALGRSIRSGGVSGWKLESRDRSRVPGL